MTSPAPTPVQRLALVDDDGEVTAFVGKTLTDAGYYCTLFGTGNALLARLRRDTFDLLLLDWNLPDLSGLDLLRAARHAAAGSGVIMLTNRSGKEDIAAALNAGADDYIVKPESAVVIVARVEAVLRRALSPSAADRLLEIGGYRFDRLSGRVSIVGEEVALSAKEFALAVLLFENIDRAIARRYLLETIWRNYADLPTRTLDVHISRIRAKLRLSPATGFRIVSISSYGYRLERFAMGG